jgi:methionyl aminopeptidase
MGKVTIKTEREINLMKESCRIVSEVLSLVGAEIKPGVRTRELDQMAEEYIRAKGAEPAFKGYGHDKHNLFPSTLCISVEDEVVHGIPDGRRLEEGQVVSIDVGVKKDNYFGDGARTFAVGRTSHEKSRLLKVTEESLYRGIEMAKQGNHLHDVSCIVQKCVEEAGFSVVRDLVGHGIGKQLHEEPAMPDRSRSKSIRMDGPCERPTANHRHILNTRLLCERVGRRYLRDRHRNRNRWQSKDPLKLTVS